MYGDFRRDAAASAASLDRDPRFESLNGRAVTGEDRAATLGVYWHLLVKHRIVIAAFFIGALLIGLAITLLMTPTYTARTTLQIDREAARVLGTDDDVLPAEAMTEGEEFFQTQYGVLRSRSLMQSVVDSLGLASSDNFLQQMGERAPTGAGVERSRRRADAVLKVVQENVGVQPVRGSRLVSITFTSPDPALSARIANAFAENFIRGNLDRKFESSSYAREFLEDRLAQTKARLEETERSLVAYAGNQQIINLREAGAEPGAEPQSLQEADLGALNASLARARAERVAAEETWRLASTASLMTLPEVLQNQAIQRLTETRAQTSASYEQKLAIYGPDYPEIRQLRAQVQEIDAQIASLAGNIRTSLRQKYVAAANEERSLRANVTALKGDVLDYRNRSIEYNILRREVDTNRTLYEGLLQRYKEVGVAGGLASNNISVVDEAEAPLKPSSPRLLLNLVLAAFVGLGLGAVTAFLIEALDQTLATPEDVENKLGLTLLGAIPVLPKGATPRLALEDVRSPFSEAYQSLRTALQFSSADGVPPVLMVTSSRPGEGKSTTALSLADNFARLGRRVLLIDLDLRNPSMHRLLDADNSRGMSDALSGSAQPGDIIRPAKGVPNLDFAPSGPLPPNPAELLSGHKLSELLATFSELYELVIIDGPPVLGFADAPVLADATNGTLFVVQARATRRAQARGAISRLMMGKGKILGVVLTKFDPQVSSQYGSYNYAYDYGYGATAKDGKKVA